MPSARPPLSPPETVAPPAPLLTRAGSLLGTATLAALLGSIPATVRVAAVAGGPLGVWLVLAACALVPLLGIVAFLRSARETARAMAGGDGSVAAWAVTAWAILTFLVLSLYGALLRATTHHHGLAGVTFAIGGLAIAGVLALFVRRLAALARGVDPWGRAALFVSTLGALGAALLVLAVRVGRAGGVDVPSTAVVDVLAFAIAAGALSRRAFVAVPWLARGGLPLALGVLVLGGALLSRNPGLAEVLRTHAPLFAPMAALAASR